jgi:hypothetical protein
VLAREGGSSRLISGSRLLRDEGNDRNSGCGTVSLGRCAWQGEAGDGPAGTRRAADRQGGARHVAGEDITRAQRTDQRAHARLDLRVRRQSGMVREARAGALERVTSRSEVDSLRFNNV